jgi:hypothetical protein
VLSDRVEDKDLHLAALKKHNDDLRLMGGATQSSGAPYAFSSVGATGMNGSIPLSGKSTTSGPQGPVPLSTFAGPGTFTAAVGSGPVWVAHPETRRGW